MQERFKLFRRGAVFYCQDRSTGLQKSLQTRDEFEARRIIQAKSDTVSQPLMNLVMVVGAGSQIDHPHLGGRHGAVLQPQQTCPWRKTLKRWKAVKRNG